MRETGSGEKQTSCEKSGNQSATAERVSAALLPTADDDVYELVNHYPRGFAVIVNIAKGRPGSEKDVSMMTDLFSQLQYQVMTLDNVTKEVGDAGSFIEKKIVLIFKSNSF